MNLNDLLEEIASLVYVEQNPAIAELISVATTPPPNKTTES